MTSLPPLPSFVSKAISAATTPGAFVQIEDQSYTAAQITNIVQGWQSLQTSTPLGREHSQASADVYPVLRSFENLSAQTQPALYEYLRKIRLGFDAAAVQEKLEAAKQHIGPLVRANTYEEWKHQVEILDLKNTISTLETILQSSSKKDAQAQFLELTQARQGLIAGTDLDFSRDPDSICNALLISVATDLFPIHRASDLVAVVFPEVVYTFELSNVCSKKLSIRKVRLEESVNTSMFNTVDRIDLSQIVVLGSTAIFSADYEAIAASPKSKWIDASFWLPMQISAPGLFEKLTATSKSLEELAKAGSTQSAHTPTLRAMLDYLARAFTSNSAHGGSGSTEVAGAGAGLALEQFEKDWAHFADIHQSAVGQSIQNIIREVRGPRRGCVWLASKELNRILQDQDRLQEPLLDQVRARPANSDKAAPSLLIQESPQSLPITLARQCGPAIEDYDSLLPYLLEIPTTMYAVLFAEIGLVRAMRIPKSAVEPLNELQKQGLRDALTTMLLTLELDQLKPDLLRVGPIGSNLIDDIISKNIDIYWNVIVNRFDKEDPQFKNLLLSARANRTPIILTAVKNEEQFESVLNSFANDLPDLLRLLTAENRDRHSALAAILAETSSVRRVNLAALLRVFKNDPYWLKCLLLSSTDVASRLIHVIAGEYDLWNTTMASFANNLPMLEELLTADVLAGREGTFLFSLLRSETTWQPIAASFANNLSDLKRLLLTNHGPYPSALQSIAQRRCTERLARMIQTFANDPASLRELLLTNIPDRFPLFFEIPPSSLLKQHVADSFVNNLPDLKEFLLANKGLFFAFAAHKDNWNFLVSVFANNLGCFKNLLLELVMYDETPYILSQIGSDNQFQRITSLFADDPATLLTHLLSKVEHTGVPIVVRHAAREELCESARAILRNNLGKLKEILISKTDPDAQPKLFTIAKSSELRQSLISLFSLDLVSLKELLLTETNRGNRWIYEILPLPWILPTLLNLFSADLDLLLELVTCTDNLGYLLIDHIPSEDQALWMRAFSASTPKLIELLTKPARNGTLIDKICTHQRADQLQVLLSLFARDLQSFQKILCDPGPEERAPIEEITAFGSADRIAIWDSICHAFSSDLPSFKKLLMAKPSSSSPVAECIISLGISEMWASVLSAFSKDLKSFKDFLTSQMDGYSPLNSLAFPGRKDKLQATLKIFTGDLPGLTELLRAPVDRKQNALISTLIGIDNREALNLVLAAFSHNLTNLETLLVTPIKDDTGESPPICLIASKYLPSIIEAIYTAYLHNLDSLKNLLLTKDASGKSAFKSLFDPSSDNNNGRIYRLFESRPDLLQALIGSIRTSQSLPNSSSSHTDFLPTPPVEQIGHTSQQVQAPTKTRTWTCIASAASIGVALATLALAGVFIAQALVASGAVAGQLALLSQITALNWKVAAVVAGSLGAAGLFFAGAGIYGTKQG